MPSKPYRTAPLVFTDARVQVYADGTWVALERGPWTLPDDSRVYAANAGPASRFTPWGHRKDEKATSPSGVFYDFWKISG